MSSFPSFFILTPRTPRHSDFDDVFWSCPYCRTLNAPRTRQCSRCLQQLSRSSSPPSTPQLLVLRPHQSSPVLVPQVVPIPAVRPPVLPQSAIGAQLGQQILQLVISALPGHPDPAGAAIEYLQLIRHAAMKSTAPLTPNRFLVTPAASTVTAAATQPPKAQSIPPRFHPYRQPNDPTPAVASATATATAPAPVAPPQHIEGDDRSNKPEECLPSAGLKECGDGKDDEGRPPK